MRPRISPPLGRDLWLGLLGENGSEPGGALAGIRTASRWEHPTPAPDQPLRTSHWLLSGCRAIGRTAHMTRKLPVPKSLGFCLVTCFLVRISSGISPQGGKAAGTANGLTWEALGALHLLAVRVAGQGGRRRKLQREVSAQRPTVGGAYSARRIRTQARGSVRGQDWRLAGGWGNWTGHLNLRWQGGKQWGVSWLSSVFAHQRA